MIEKKQSDLGVLLGYAGSYKGLTFLGLGLSAVAMILGMLPYICIWLVARELIAVAPNWSQATDIARYGWMAFAFAFAGIIVYFAALMCTHLAAFRTASNIRKQGMAHLMKAPLGYFDSNASGLLRNRLDGASAETETLLAHNLADIVGSIAMLLATVVLMFVFDWRMGAACLLAAVVSVGAMFSMMGGKNAKLMAEYQAAQDVMSKAGTEYLGLFLGLRRSEVVGLRWKDVDLENGIVHIRNTVVKFKEISELEKTKSRASRRDLYMPNALKSYLQTIWDRQEEDRKLTGRSYSDSEHICQWPDGTAFHPDYVSRRFQKVLECNHLPKIRFHDLRHTTGSLLVNQGHTIKQVQEFLGHEKASTTLDIYTHISLEGKRNTAQVLDELLA